MTKETPGYQDMMLLAETHKELRIVCFTGKQIKCPGSGKECTEVIAPAFLSPYYLYQSAARGKCTECGAGLGLMGKTQKVATHNKSSHEPCCQGRLWTLLVPEKWLGKLVRIMGAHGENMDIYSPHGLELKWRVITDTGQGFLETPEAALAAALVMMEAGP